ncbi:protein dopey homolog PFC0245c-like isoform X2 [Polistes fuscatus]|uniref:protein dopey homolog PFC0245c-like isoform X2 n=1 Tax=Polistes fuscatus TaxID=30207 RepID=UPI001CA96632|nr:protein dopey homolog PFC0245c-like isoform X2 [Polistes fuscatus]
MEEEKVNLSNYPDCTVLSTSINFKKVYESLNNKYKTCLTNNKSICHNQKQKKVKKYFNDDLDNIKDSREDVNKENIKCNAAEERNIQPIDSNCFKNTNTTDLFKNNVPLSILIKQMVDEAFGKPSDIINVKKGNVKEVNLHNTSDKINNTEQSLELIIENKDSIVSTTDTNDTASSNETFLDRVKCDDKLITIEEESENSLSNYNIVENTGMHLSKLLKFDAESNNRINKDNNIVSSKDNNDNSAIISKISKDIFNSSVLFNTEENKEEELDNSLYFRDFVKMKSLLINQKTNIDNKFVALETANDSTNNLSFEINEDQTMNIFNISNDKNIVENKESFNEQSNLSKREEMKEISSFNDNSINTDPSTKKEQKFINEVTINLRTPCKRREFTTFCHISLSKRTPKLSMNTKTVISRKNYTVLTNKPIKHANISSTDFANASKKKITSKIPKLQQQNRAKLFESRDINKKQQILIPQLILTPATPE